MTIVNVDYATSHYDYEERKEARERFKQDALAAWAEYQETGQHLTGEEVRNWLGRWGSDHEEAMPQCHD